MFTLQDRYRIRRYAKSYFIGVAGFGALFVIVNLVGKHGRAVEDLLIFGGAFDGETYITGSRGNCSQQIIRDFLCIIPDKSGQDTFTRIEAKEARYIPPSDEPHSGGWMLTRTRPLELDKSNQPASLEMIDPGRFFLRTKDVDFATLARNPMEARSRHGCVAGFLLAMMFTCLLVREWH